MNGPMKYVITNETKVMNGETLYRIQSLVDFKTIDGRSVERGDYGGYVSSLNCLSQKGKSWIRSNACVIGGRVSSNALVAGKAIVIGGKVMHNSTVKGNAKLVCSEVYNSAVVQDNAEMNESYVGGTSVICGNAVVNNSSQIFGCSRVQDNAQVTNRSYILDGSVCDSSALIHAHIEGYRVKGNSRVRIINSSLTHGTKVVGKSLIRNCTLAGSHVIGDCKLTNVRTGVNRVMITNSVITCDIMLTNYYDIVNANIQHTSDYFVSPYFFAYNRNDGDITFIFDNGWSDTHKRLSEYDEYIAEYKDSLQTFFKDIKPIVVRYLKGEYHHE